jgi:hypothetical protein
MTTWTIPQPIHQLIPCGLRRGDLVCSHEATFVRKIECAAHRLGAVASGVLYPSTREAGDEQFIIIDIISCNDIFHSGRL